jgi:rare lipoprotein A
VKQPARALAALALLLAACQPAPLPPGSPRYTIGEPYALGGLWSDPAEVFAGSETGLASVLPESRRGRTTANGEIFDPTRLVAAHRTLQLPAIVSVQNLENGRALRVRVDDRGPNNPGRLIGLSPRAATLLGIPAGGAAQVRVTLDELPSRALARLLPSTERSAPVVAAVPQAKVETESLAPLAGARDATRIRSAPAGPAIAVVAVADPALPPDPLPETITQGAPAPGRLMLEAGSFAGRDPAQRQAAKLAGLGARIEPTGPARDQRWRVRLGPYPNAAAADAALTAALGRGIGEIRLLID